MTSISHLYNDLSNHAPNTQNKNSQPPADEELEELKLISFEAGYQAGWDDAVKAHAKENSRLTADFVQHVEDMSFTYHEAYAKLSAGMKPLLTGFVTKLLPKMAEQSLGAHLIDQISTLIDAEAENAIELAVSPDKSEFVQDLLESKLAVPFHIVAEPALSSAQVYLRVNQTEREINLDAVLEGVTAAVDAFFHASEQESPHD